MFKLHTILIVLLVQSFIAFCGNIPPIPVPLVTVHKCCPQHQYMLDYVSEIRCKNITNETARWEPIFEDQGIPTSSRLIIGIPACQTTTRWRVDDIKTSCDRLVLLKDGKLRHIAYQEDSAESCRENEAEKHQWDFPYNEYCIDNVSKNSLVICTTERMLIFFSLVAGI